MTDEERKLKEEQERAAKEMQKFADALDDLIARNKAAEKESVDNTKKRFKDLDAALRTGRKRWTEIVDDLQNLEDSINDVTDANEKQALQKTLEERKSAARSAQYQKLMLDSTEQVAKGLINTGASITKSVINSYQSGASAFQLFGDASIAGIDATNQTVKGVTGVMSSVGTALMPFGGYATAAGVALNVLAGITSTLSESFSDLAKFGISVAVKEIEATTKAYKQATSVGALFADGIDGIRRGSVEAGLTMAQFTKVIAENSEGLAAYGGSVTGGMEAFKRLHKAMLPAREGLIALGYSIEDIADGTASYMSLIGSVSSRQRDDYENLARETDSYLTNLKLISAFTGKDAKKMEEEARKRATQAAVQAKIAQAGTPEQVEQAQVKFARAMQLATSELERDVIQQLYATGAVVGDAAIMMGQLPATAEYLKTTVSAINDTSLSYEDMSRQLIDKRIAGNQAMLDEQLRASKTFGTIAVLGKGQEQMAQSLSDQTRASVKISKMSHLSADSFTQLIGDVKDQGKDLTTGTGKYATLVTKGQDLSIRVQEQLDAVIDQFEKFANIANAVIEGIEKSLSKAGITSPGGKAAADRAKNPKALVEAIKQSFSRPAEPTTGAEMPTEGTGAVPSIKTTEKTDIKLTTGTKGSKLPNGQITDQLSKILENPILSGLTVTSKNDSKHAADSMHYYGKAADFRIKHLSPQEIAKIVSAANSIPGVKKAVAEDRPGSELLAQIKAAGGRTETNPNASGLHMHLEALAKGGITDGPSIAGEAGPEAVVPLPDGRNIPVKVDNSAVIDKLEEMISVLKNQEELSRKLLQVSQ